MVSVRFEKMGPASVLKTPIPSLQLKTLPRISNEGLSEAQAKDPGPLLINISSSANILGVPIDSVTLGSGLSMGQPFSFFGQRESQWNLRLPRYVVDAIEGIRQHDVNVVLTVEFLLWLPGTQENRFPWQWTNAQFTEDISQVRWLSILEELGQTGGWLFEVRKPKSKGMEAAAKYLVEAEANLSGHNPKAALLACRQAWNTVDSILDPLRSEVEGMINGLSKGEKGFPSKSDRYSKIQEGVEALSQLGPHEEAYEVTMDDALTAYRITVVLVSFLSKKIVEAEEVRSAKRSTK